MNVNNISFGQMYFQDSLQRYMPQKEQDKLFYSYGLGELYPVDIFVGANKKGDLTVKIKHSNLWEFLMLKEQIPMSIQNISAYYFIKAVENVSKSTRGDKYPVMKSVIKDVEHKSEHKIMLEILDKISDYYDKYGNMFIS